MRLLWEKLTREQEIDIEVGLIVLSVTGRPFEGLYVCREDDGTEGFGRSPRQAVESCRARRARGQNPPQSSEGVSSG